VKRRRWTLVGRDQRASAFSGVLLRLCDATGALGAALVDPEGETVDYGGAVGPFDIKIAAAEWIIVLSLLRASRVLHWPDTDQILLRGAQKSFVVQLLDAGYALVVQLPVHAFGISRRGMQEAVRELCAEAELDLPRSLREAKEHWCRVDVRCEPSDPKRPREVWAEGGWCGLEILGRWSEAGERGEIGYRTRMPSGAEINLVREQLGRWYTDSPNHARHW